MRPAPEDGAPLGIGQFAEVPLTREAVEAITTPLLRNGHAHHGERLCGECAARIEKAARAIVVHLLASLDHAPTAAGTCPAMTEREAGWVLVMRIDGAGPTATRHALAHLAATLEAELCDHRRDALGAPVLADLITPATAAMPDAGTVTALTTGINATQTYLWTRAAARMTDAPGLADRAAAELADVARLVGLVVLAMAVAAARRHEGIGPGHQGPGQAGHGQVVITADTIRGTDHTP